MKIAICCRKGSFSDYWLTYCEENGISYKKVDAYQSDIMKQIEDCDAFMWHFSHLDYKDKVFAKQLLYSIEASGKPVFPNFKTVWHFDDKLGQKYLFESIKAPLVTSYAFYTKQEALLWANKASFPKVFKLRGGAGSTNVKLVDTRKEAVSLISRAFSRGFSAYDPLASLKDRWRDYRSGKCPFFVLLKSFFRLFIVSSAIKLLPLEKGYVYFQDFIPNNDTDTRIVVIGDKIIGERRGVRNGDFRASGSHILLPDASKVDMRCVQLAYNVSQKLGLQIGVFDFVHDKDNPLLVEVSYGTDPDYTECEGYWNEKLQFTSAPINLPKMIIESFIQNNSN